MNNNENESIKIEINEVESKTLDNSDAGSIGSADDLLDNNKNNKDFLGFNLPTNDLTKSGQLDNISVDSYWINEDDIDDINREKKLDPINPNYKSVYKNTIRKFKETKIKENVNDNEKKE